MRLAFCIVLAIALVLGSCTVSKAQMIVAHRGASYDAPENTLAAFRLAWEQGSDGIEGDFYLTADGKIVCIHDPDTKRTAGAKRIVEQSTLAQLRQLEYGSWKDPKWKGEAIPTFEEVFRTVPDGKTFVIELKSKKAIVPVLAAELARLQTDSIRLLIISFDQETVQACKALMPSIGAHWLTKFELDEAKSSYHPTADEITATVRRLGADGVGMRAQREVVDTAFMRQLQAGGCNEFHVWTVDSIADAKYFQQLGVVGITTNRPREIGAAIRQSDR